jgi:cytochrome c551/c552
VGLLALVLAGCGASTDGGTQSATTASVPAYVTEPFTHEQKLIEQGARLVVADGCSSCHLMSDRRSLGPSFSSFAGHRVALTDGRKVLVDERFLRRGLLHPRSELLEGYDPAPMLAALARLHLAEEPHQVAALAAFIEQVGPEP